MHVDSSPQQSLNEYFSFLNLLGSDPQLKLKYYSLTKRSEREKFIESLGFKPREIRAAIESIEFEYEGKQYTLLSWLESKGYDDDSDLPVAVLQRALVKTGLFDNFKSLQEQFESYQDVVGAAAGGAALAPSTNRSSSNKPEVEVEFNDVSETEGDRSESEVADLYGSDVGIDNDINDVDSNASFGSEADSASEASGNFDISEFDQASQGGNGGDALNDLVSSQLDSYASTTEDLVGTSADVSTSESQTIDLTIDRSSEITTPGINETVGPVDIQTQGNINVNIDASVDINTSDPSASTVSVEGSSVDIQESVDASGSNDFTNAYGSIDVSGDASSTVNVDINPSDSSDPLSVSSSGINVDLKADINEQGPGFEKTGENYSVDEKSSLSGEINASGTIDLQDPSASTVSFDGTNLDLTVNSSAEGSETFTNQYGSTEANVSATNTASLDFNPENSSDPVSFDSSGIKLDASLDINESKSSDVMQYDSGALTGDLSADASVTGTLNADATINLRDSSDDTVSFEGTNIDIDADLAATSSADFTNAYGSIDAKGTATSNLSIDINPADGSQPITVSDSGINVDTTATVNEKFDGSNVQSTTGLKPEVGVTGSVNLQGNIDLKDPSESKITDRSSNLDISMSVSDSASGSFDADGVKIGATVDGTLDFNVEETSNDGKVSGSYNFDGSTLDLDISAKDESPTLVEETAEGEYYVQPEATADISLEYNSEDNISKDVKPSFKLDPTFVPTDS